MKKILLSTLIMIAGLFTLAVGARAETAGVVFRIDREFMAGGKAFPAGTYKMYRSSPEAGLTLVLRGKEAGTSVFLLPSTYDSDSTRRLEVKLRRAGDAYYLSEVVTEFGVYTFTAPRTPSDAVEARGQNGIAGPGNN
jgi:hypothetical protein